MVISSFQIYWQNSVKPPTGIPRTMLMTTQDGSYALSSGAVAVLKPNEAAFEKKIKGLPSTRSVGDLPPEFHCPLCKQVMKDAVLTGKCCFRSFCDKCIRYHISSKSMCVCGTTNILADDIFPNLTLRETINRTLVSYNNNVNGGSASQVREMDSKIPQPEMELKIPSPTCDFVSMKGPAFQGSTLPADEGGQQKPVCGEAGKKKKKKKAHFSVNATELEWKNSQDHAANYMMNQGHAAYDPYCSGTLAGMEGYAAIYGSSLPCMGYSLGPLDIPFGIYPQDPFLEQGYMMPPVPSDRDVADFGGHLNVGPPIMTKEDFEAQKANMRRKHEIESKEVSKDVKFNSSGNVSSLKSKSKLLSQQSSMDHHHHHRRPKRSPMEHLAHRREVSPISRKPSRDNSDHNHHHHCSNHHHSLDRED